MSTDKRPLRDLTDEVDQLHHESLRSFPEEAHELHFGESGRSSRESRRRFLATMAAGGTVLGVGSVASPFARFLPAAWAQAPALDDGSIAKYLMTLEYAAVETYRRAVASGKVSPARTELATMFSGHHQDHGDGFADLITAADADKLANRKVLDAFTPQLTAAADEKAVLEVALRLEEALAATYLFVLGELTDKVNAGIVATVLPVESQHAVVLAQATGAPIAQFVPPFETARAALDPTAYAS